MNNLKTTTFFKKFLIVIVLVSFLGLTKSQEVDDESEFSYEEDSKNGPAHWGEIKPEWRMCNSGSTQSPIDLLNERVEVVSHLGRLHRDYKPSNATLINRGHDMMLSWEAGAGSIQINGTLYQLRQCHWHSPSEHTLNGRRFDLEIHMVHESMDNRTAVIGIMYKIGRPDSFLSMMKQDFKALVDTRNVERAVGIIDPKLIKLGSRKYYRYIGSLTVPPCTQDVSWTILRKVRTVTREQVKLFREAVHDEYETNARPIQPINHRRIKLYRPRDNEN
ncbi:alpha carbonic anhydrase 7-like [Olea europaea var. sylvestris]|uniref:alpha carbonic anhydrase 7-like n=1 Tax=Olea europaea var. sylvestris TaxID=158386 RepID=UPI000C1D36DD|nr:alpha carbonic anhydrase 7-like [Olea europaea var. sylvestris]